MFCPKCSQQQAFEDVRFCPRCGLPLEGVALVVANGGMLPSAPEAEGELPPPSPKLRGVRQGGKMMLLGLLIVPLIILISESLRMPEEPAIASAVLFFVGGLVRILYALLFQDGPLRRKQRQPPHATATGFAQPAALGGAWARQDGALPPAREGIPAAAYTPPRATTTDALQPPRSVTEGTTRLLKEDE